MAGVGVAEVDVLVVGGGPAGLAAALVLGRKGLRVRVWERERGPRDKVCGEGVMPPGVRLLQELGVSRWLDLGEVRPFSGIGYETAGGGRAEAEFAEGPGWGIRRTNLSRALRRAVEEEGLVKLEEGVAAQSMEVGRDAVRVTGGSGEVRARLVVGADGLRSRVRSWAGLEGRASERRRFGIRQHFAVPAWSRLVEVCSGDGMEAYVTPCGEGQVGVAILWEKGRVADLDLGRGRELFPSLLRRFPRLAERLKGAEAASEPGATGPLEQRARGRVADGVVLTGDAGGYLDACTGEGITLALKGAMFLEREVAPVLLANSGVPARWQLQGYETACRAMMRPYVLGTSLLLALQRRPALMEEFVRQMARRPEWLQYLLSFNMGTAPFWPESGRGRAGR